MQKPFKVLNKKILSSLVAKKINYTIHYTHITNVISMFIDEFMMHLQQKEQINISNFCSFKLEKSKPRKFHNVRKRRFAVSAGTVLIKIKLSRALRNKIIQNMDLIKTFL